MAALQPTTDGSVLEPQLLHAKRFRTTELPLNAAQRTSVDNLLHAIKKKGAFDNVRKRVWSQFAEDAAKTELTAALAELVESETDRDHSLLSRERGKAATLIQGAVDRSNVYKTVEEALDRLIAEHLNNVEMVARELRRAEIGEEAALHEVRRGAKTDEQYDEEVAAKRVIREKIRKQEDAKKRREEEKERLREEEKQKLAELENLRRMTEKRKEDEARATRRKAERADREARREAERKVREEQEAERKKIYAERKAQELELENEREKERELERAKDKDRRRSRSRDYDRHRHRDDTSPKRERASSHRQRSRSPTSGRLDSPEVAVKKEMTDAEIEEAALELLIKEGKELAAKSQPPTDLERSASLEPPLRRGQVLKSRLGEIRREDLRTPTRLDGQSSRRDSVVEDSRKRDESRTYSTGREDRYRDDYRRDSRDFYDKDHHRQDSYYRDDHRRDEYHKDDLRRDDHRKDTYREEGRREDYRRDDRDRARPFTENSRRRSRSRPAHREDREDRSTRQPQQRRIHNTEEKEEWKREAARKRELEAEAYKKSSRESEDATSSRGHRGSASYHASRRQSRSRSPAYRSKYGRSRSPRARSGYHDEPGHLRAKSPPDIDRYVPGRAPRPRSRDRDRDRESAPRHERDERDRRDRDRDRERYVKSEREKGRD